jgi:hypothetical protein
VAALVAIGSGAATGDDLPFVRVIVPTAAVPDVPRGEGRFIPLPLAEFDEAVARLNGSSALRRPGASSATYTLATADAGGLAGTLEFTVEETAGVLPSHLPLGRVSIGRCSMRTDEGSGDAVAYGMPDGGIAIRTAGPGTYRASIQIPTPATSPLVVLPLVPALVTTVDLTLPLSVQPFIGGTTASTASIENVGKGRWKIVVGPMDALTLVLHEKGAVPPPLTAFNAVSVRGRQAAMIARIEPVDAWGPGDLVLALEPSALVARVLADDAGELRWQSADGMLTIAIPPSLVGSRRGVVVHAVAPRSEDGPWTVATVQPLPEQWAGCGVELLVDPAIAVGGIELDQCLVVSRADASDWPLPAHAADMEPQGVDAGPRPARMYLEHQAATALARVVMGPRQPVFDTARVTTVDISPGTVLGRANCDVRVVSGEAFEIVADIAPGWIIDAVEAIDFSARAASDGSATDSLDWRVVRAPRASELRIGLARAATSRRSLGLRISGHRVGLPLGAEFTTKEMDMVRLVGEGVGMALLEFRVGPTAVVEVAGTAMGLEPAGGRLAQLTGESPPRARIQAGERVPSLRARLVRRRPPVTADVQLALTARDERLAEAFTFTCRPVVGELDALVVHFSEPLGPGLEWSLVDPPGGTLAARPLATRGGSRGTFDEAAALGLSAELASGSAIAETWLVELRPATTSAVTIRASRTVPLAAAVPVPLAWVEAAERPGGVVAVRGGRGRRPEIVNRRLRELPPAADGDDTALVELAYGPPETVLAADGSPAADILPPALATGARAWAWREVMYVWCHESGALEWETTIDLENQGRDELTLSVPAGLSLESIEIGGVRIAAEPVEGQDAPSVPLPLPSQRGRVTLKLSGSASRDPSLGWWSVGVIACGIDVPVLDREVKLFLSPGLELAGSADARESSAGWSERLFLATPSSSRVIDVSRPGFRGIPITAATRGGIADVFVVRRDVVTSLSIFAAALAAIVGFLVAGRSGLAAVAGCVLAAGAALWCEPPWYAVARAAWWGGLLGTWLAGCRRRPGRIVTIMLVATAIAFGGTQAHAQETTAVPNNAAHAKDQIDGMPLRVFVTPAPDGGTALVPEELFRRLTAASSGPPPVRVMTADVTIDQTRGIWWIALDLDTDRGGSLILDQRPAAAVWVPDLHELPPGIAMAPTAGFGEARLIATLAGRHRVKLACRPGTVREGGIELATACLPVAARATLSMSEFDSSEESMAAWQCDRERADANWEPAPHAGPLSFDVSGASRVRIARPLDPRDRLVSELRTAVSANDIDWLTHECRVTATFDVGGDREIVRSVIVRADPDLVPVVVAGERKPRSLGAGRWLLEQSEPRAGLARMVLVFRRVLADPVGVFEPPAAWLEGVASDGRTVRLRPAATLEAVVELPLGMTLVRPRVEDGPTTTAVWRSDIVAAATEAIGSTTLPSPPITSQRNPSPRIPSPQNPSPKITVKRRPPTLRGSQELAVQFEESAVSLRLRCQMEASPLPLVEIPITLPPAAVIDRVTLVREDALLAMAMPPEGIDTAWSRVAADRIVVMVQRPRPGRFRLDLNARMPIPPAVRGRVPMARVVSTSDLPLALTCTAAPPLSVTLMGPRGAVVPFLADRLDLAANAPAPQYELLREPGAPEWAPAPSGSPEVKDDHAAVELTMVDLAIDRRGRCRGLVRFDLVAVEPTISLRLPAGMRLFDVRVDGREVTATPRAGDTWDVRLHDVSWPRTVVAVISGIVGGRLVDGEPIRLDPPRIKGLEGGLVLWSLETPAGLEVRISEPSRVLDGPQWRAMLGERRARQEASFDAAMGFVPGADFDRMRAFAAVRRDGSLPTGERDWYAAWRRPRGVESVRTRLVAGAGGSVTLRAVPDTAVSVAGRGLATAVLVALALAGWQVARRFPDHWRLVLPRLHEWWWVACGVIWIVMLEPSLPGWCMLAVGAWIAWATARQLGQRRGKGSDISAAGTTRTMQPIGRP